jgi:WD40 repeat protein
MRAPDPPTILFLGANPGDLTRRALDREIRAISHGLQATPHGRPLRVAQEWAVRAKDLQACLLKHEPEVVHFSGQGSEAGQILVEDEQGTAAPVDPEALAELFGLLGGGIRCVVLNACFSAEQARAITRHVDCVIGMGGALEDGAAILWSAAFYQALGYGKSIGKAFALAGNQIDLSSLPGGKVPELIERQGARAEQVHLGSGVAGVAFVVPFFQNPDFVGRDDDLERLHALLAKGEAVGVRPAALTGMGGIGKTQLAVEYAYRYRGAYPGGVYWVNAAQSWQAELARLAEKMGLREDDAPESERQKRLARAFADYLAERSDALVIFDNVEDPLALRDPTAEIIPAQLGCRLLFTTRRRNLGSFAGVEVHVLPPSNALEVLLSNDARRDVVARGDGAERAEAEAICRALGYLPLALVLAAAYLGENPDITLRDYRGRLEREGVLATVDDNEFDERALLTRHPTAVGATLRLQWDALKSEEAKRVLQTAALLGEVAQVSRATLALLTGLRDKAERGYPARLGSALWKLGELSLVEELTEQAIRLHPLVREIAEKQITEREAFKTACAERLVEALWEMGQLHEEVALRGVDAVIGDLRLGAALAGADGQERCERLIRPLDREAHALRAWNPGTQPEFFLQQLRNRCFEMGLEEVQRGAEAKLEERRWPYLRERLRTSRESKALMRTLEGHTDWVKGVTVTSDGRHAVSASDDHTLKVWDLLTGKAVKTLQGHTDGVTGVAVTADSLHAISASSDRTLKVWDLLTGKEIKTLQGHTGVVTCVTVPADSLHAVSASSDGTLKVWDLWTGKEVKTFEGHTGWVNGVAVMADGRQAVSASSDGTLKVWDLWTGKEVKTFEGHTDGVTSVAVMADGRQIVSTSSDGTLKVWDLWTGQEVKSLEGHSDRVNSVAVTADGRHAVSASSDRTLKVWDLWTGQEVKTLEGHTNRVNRVAVTADGRHAVSASEDETLKVWDLLTGQEIRTLEGHTGWVKGVAVTADGRHAVSGSWDRTLKVWDLLTGKEVRTLEGHTDGVNGVAVIADGRHAVSASDDRTLKVWDLLTGQAIATLKTHAPLYCCAVTPDGKTLLAGDRAGSLHIVDWLHAEPLARR